MKKIIKPIKTTKKIGKIGLIIQGPLMSIGKSGHNAHISQDKLGKDDLVRYDCRQNIKNIVNDFGELFDAIVVSTWDNELRPGDQRLGVKVVSMPDPGGIKRPNLYKETNKFRQFTGIRHGLIELRKMKRKIDYVVIIRADQYLNLRELVNSFIKGVNGKNYHSEMIYVPLFRPVNFMLADFYFASSFQTMKKFCDAILAYDKYEFITCVHREMVLKHAYALHKNVIGVPDWAYFPRHPTSGASAMTKKIFTFMFKNIYVPLSPETFRSILFRGSFFNEQYLSSRLYREDLHSNNKIANLGIRRLFSLKNYNVPALPSIDWERYFAFRQKTKDIKSSLRNKLVIRVGKFSWMLWILFRKVRSIIKKGLLCLKFIS